MPSSFSTAAHDDGRQLLRGFRAFLAAAGHKAFLDRLLDFIGVKGHHAAVALFNGCDHGGSPLRCAPEPQAEGVQKHRAREARSGTVNLYADTAGAFPFVTCAAARRYAQIGSLLLYCVVNGCQIPYLAFYVTTLRQYEE
jgi:hypothetical protein